MAPGRGRRAHAGRTRHRRQRQPLGPLESSPFPFSYSYTNNLFIHDQASDVSLVRAGRDIIAGSFTVAGPGTLEISAGRNIQMLDQAAVLSMGPVVPGDTRPAPASPCRPAWARRAPTTPASCAATWTRPASPIRRGR